MLGNLLSTASGALRSPYGLTGPAVAGVRQINPVVRGTTPGASPDNTRYTPAPSRPDTPLYNRVGGLNESGYQAVGQSVSYARNDTFDLRIQTADGDIATIRISQQQSFDASAGAVTSTGRAGQTSLQALSFSSGGAHDVDISVTGDLSAEETASINALVSQVYGVAEDFFAGDVAEATQAAKKISFGPDDSTLSAYEFSLQTQESLRAVAVYESVASTTGPDLSVAPSTALSAPAVEPVATAPKAKSDYLQSLRAMLEDFTRNAKALTATLQT